MTGSHFDGLTRQLGRRRALQAIGAATFSLAAGVPLAAGKNRKGRSGKGKKRKGNAFTLCEAQVSECQALVATVCNGDPACVARQAPCCNPLATCDFNAFITCIQAS